MGLLSWSIAALRVSPGDTVLDALLARAAVLLEEHAEWAQLQVGRQQQQLEGQAVWAQQQSQQQQQQPEGQAARAQQPLQQLERPWWMQKQILTTQQAQQRQQQQGAGPALDSWHERAFGDDGPVLPARWQEEGPSAAGCALTDTCSAPTGTCSTCGAWPRGVKNGLGGAGGDGYVAAGPLPAAALAQLCYALCMLRHTPEPHFMALLVAAVVPPPGGPLGDGQGAPAAAFAVAGDDDEDEDASAGGAFGTAVMGDGPPPALLPHLGPRELLLLCMALAHWGHALRPDAASAVLHAVRRALPVARGAAVAGLLWCVAQLRLRPARGWMCAATRALSACEAELSPLDAARALRSLGALGYAPPAPLGVALLDRLAANIVALPAKHLFPALGAAAALRQRPGSVASAKALLWGPQVSRVSATAGRYEGRGGKSMFRLIY